jgi:succinate dehydrogenase / fumarate reductase flavoprotein subunit
MDRLDPKIPEGPLHQNRTSYKASAKACQSCQPPKTRHNSCGYRHFGAAASSALGELGYNVKSFCYQILPGGHIQLLPREEIKCCKKLTNDGDSISRLFMT